MGRPRERTMPEQGDVFGLWEVVSAGTRCLCRCSCGVEKYVYLYDLLDSRSTKCRSCGSMYESNSGERPERRAIPEMNRWLYRKLRHAAVNAVSRCTNRNHPRFADWGGRGITVHSEWKCNITLFVAYLSTLEGCNESSLVMDRINNDGHYEPGNIRFVDRSTSQRNRR